VLHRLPQRLTEEQYVTIAWAEGNKTNQISFKSLAKYSNSDSLYSDQLTTT